MNHEIEIFRRHGLFWSGTLAQDSSGKILADGDYIQMPERFSDCFWVIFDRLGQVNDYCFQQLISSEAKLKDLENERKDLGSGKLPLECASQLDYLDEAIPNWTHNVNVIAKSSILIVLSSFVEWALKRVIQEFLGEVSRNQMGGKSKIDSYLLLLNKQVFSDMTIPAKTKYILDSFRKSRNEFAHGDWETLENTLSSINLREAFESVSELLFLLEEHAWSSEWGSHSSS